jgi:hypothetical protein
VFDDLAGLFYESVGAAYSVYAESRDNAKAGRNNLLRTAIEVATALCISENIYRRSWLERARRRFLNARTTV